jgi:hypothetical protein
MTVSEPEPIGMSWEPARPHILVIACSDGRLQEATDAFLSSHLRITRYDRLYVPGGGGALSASGVEFMRAHQLQQECRYLIEIHDIERVLLFFHGPSADGPPEAMCADYLRKLKWATTEQQRAQQQRDADDLLEQRWQWAGTANVEVYRCEVGPGGALSFVNLHDDTAPGAKR